MLNQLVIVGRIVKDPELSKNEDGKSVSSITLAVPRSYKNSNGEYDTDFIDFNIYGNVAETTCEYCHKGDLVGVRRSLHTKKIEENGKNINKNVVYGDRITFLSSSHKSKETEMED